MKKGLVVLIALFFSLTLGIGNSHAGMFDKLKGAMGGKKESKEATAEGDVNAEDILATVLRNINLAKEIREKSEKIKAELEKAVEEIQRLKLEAAAVFQYQNDAITRAKSTEQVSEIFTRLVSKIKNADLKSTGGLNEQLKSDETSGRVLSNKAEKVLTEDIKNRESKLKESVVYLSAVYVAFKSANHYIGHSVMPRTDKIIGHIDEAVNKFLEEGGLVAIEAVKSIGALLLEKESLMKAMKAVKKDFRKAAKIIPKIKNMISDIKNLIITLKKFKEDYDFIEAKSKDEILPHAKEARNSIRKGKENSDNATILLEKIAGEHKAEIKLASLRNQALENSKTADAKDAENL